ncbi:MAG: hypothetical protein RJQ09_02265 [Cyclobacteriaceae bacterium]
MKKILLQCTLGLCLLLMMSCGDDEPTDQQPDEVPETTLDGIWSGTFTDNIYPSGTFPFTIDVAFVNANTLRGPFYYSGSTVSCCNSQDDGEITIEFDGDVVTKLTMNQDLPFFMGGCPGFYRGSGIIKRINEFISMDLDFEGEDCEGIHVGGKLLLSKR